MSVRTRIVNRRVLLPVAVLVALAVLASWLVPGDLVRDLVVRRLEQALGRPVSVESVKVSLLPKPRVVLSGLAVAEAPNGPLASLTLAELDLTLAVGPLFKREVAIVNVVLDRPRVVVRAGSSPAPAVGDGSPGGGAAPGALRIAVRRLLVRDGAIGVRRGDLLDIGGFHEELTATLSPTGDLALAGETRIDSLRVHLPQGALGQGLSVRWRKDLRYEAATRSLDLAASTLQLGDLDVAVTGRVEGLGSAAPRADLKLDGGPVAVTSLLGFLPSWLAPRLDGVVSSGEVSLAGFVKGPLGPPPPPGGPLPFAYDLRFDLKDGRLSAPALSAPLDGIEVHLHAHDDVVEIIRLAARTPRSRLDVSGTMNSLLDSPVVSLNVDADVDLAEAMALQPPRPGQPSASGRFDGTVVVAGALDTPAKLALDGAGRLRDVKLWGPDLEPPIDRLDGPIRLRGQQLAADGVVFRQGTTDLTVTGTVDDYLALVPESGVRPPARLAVAIDGRWLDADQYAAPRDRKPEAAGASTGLARLALLTGRAEVTMRRLLTRGHELQDVQGAVVLDRGLLTLDGVRGALYGGRADLGGTVDLSDPAHGKLDLDVRLAGVQAQELSRRAVAMSRFARLGGLVTGRVDGQAAFAGSLDDTFGLDLATFTTNGQIEIREARLAGSPLQKKLAGLLASPQLEAVAVSEWLQPFRIENGRLHVDGLKLSAGGIGVRAGGWQSLAGDVALGVELTVPQSLAAGLRDKLPPAVAAALFDGSGAALVVPVGLTGRWDDPQVQLDVEALAASARDRAAGQVRRQVDQAKQEAIGKLTDEVADRASQALGRLTGQAPDTAAAGADSARAPARLGDEVKSILKGLRGRKGG